MDTFEKVHHLGVVARYQNEGRLSPYKGKPSEQFKELVDSCYLERHQNLAVDSTGIRRTAALLLCANDAIDSLALTLDKFLNLNKKIPESFGAFWKDALVCVDCGIVFGALAAVLQVSWNVPVKPGNVYYGSEISPKERFVAEMTYQTLFDICPELKEQWKQNKAAFTAKLPSLRDNLDANVGELMDLVERHGGKSQEKDVLAKWEECLQRLPVNAVTLGAAETLARTSS